MSEGISIVSVIFTPGMRTSEKPTPDAPIIDSRADQVVPSILIRRVESCVGEPYGLAARRSGLEGERLVIGWPPSNSMVTCVIHLFTVLPST